MTAHPLSVTDTPVRGTELPDTPQSPPETNGFLLISISAESRVSIKVPNCTFLLIYVKWIDD
jgi:hypothetical protein